MAWTVGAIYCCLHSCVPACSQPSTCCYQNNTRALHAVLCHAMLLQERAEALELELRKSKRAEQKLQALLFRLRQDVAEVKQGAQLMEKLQDQRGLEYEVDFLSNKVKVCVCDACTCHITSRAGTFGCIPRWHLHQTETELMIMNMRHSFLPHSTQRPLTLPSVVLCPVQKYEKVLRQQAELQQKQRGATVAPKAGADAAGRAPAQGGKENAAQLQLHNGGR